MHNATVQVVNIVQDVLTKEEARGDCHNLVLVLQHHRNYSRGEALAEARSIVRGHTDEFLRLKARLPALFERPPALPRTTGASPCLRHDLQAQMKGAAPRLVPSSSRYSRVIGARPDEPPTSRKCAWKDSAAEHGSGEVRCGATWILRRCWASGTGGSSSMRCTR